MENCLILTFIFLLRFISIILSFFLSADNSNLLTEGYFSDKDVIIFGIHRIEVLMDRLLTLDLLILSLEDLEELILDFNLFLSALGKCLLLRERALPSHAVDISENIWPEHIDCLFTSRQDDLVGIVERMVRVAAMIELFRKEVSSDYLAHRDGEDL